VKNFIFIIVLSLFLKPIFPVIEYAVNYEYISKVLCVNKAKPMMHCNGKCHLMKELAKASETEKPISSDKKTTVQVFNLFQFQNLAFLPKKKSTNPILIYIFMGIVILFFVHPFLFLKDRAFIMLMLSVL
jgi:hypothetical protein